MKTKAKISVGGIRNKYTMFRNLTMGSEKERQSGDTNGRGDREQWLWKAKFNRNCQYPGVGSYQNPTQGERRRPFIVRHIGVVVERILFPKSSWLKAWSQARRTIQIINGVVELIYREFFLLFFTG